MAKSIKTTKVTGLTPDDYRCPICDTKAQSKFKGNWMVCQKHGFIEADIRISIESYSEQIAA